MAYRLYDPHPVWFDTDGITPCAAGTLETFSDEACTAPYATFNSSALDVANPVIVSLNSAGRASVEIWAGVAFWARLKDADGNVVWTREVTSGVPADQAIPVPEEGEFLSGDGETISAVAIDLLPDPSGSADYMVVVNEAGDGYTLQAQPEAPEAPTLDITIAAGSLIVGDGEADTKSRLYAGSATGTNSGGRTQTVSVSYPADTFSGTPAGPFITITNASALATFANNPSHRVSSRSASGFTVVFTMGEVDDSQSNYDFNAGVAFDYLAFGPYEVP